jgi:hypothetical protein
MIIEIIIYVSQAKSPAFEIHIALVPRSMLPKVQLGNGQVASRPQNFSGPCAALQHRGCYNNRTEWHMENFCHPSSHQRRRFHQIFIEADGFLEGLDQKPPLAPAKLRILLDDGNNASRFYKLQW